MLSPVSRSLLLDVPQVERVDQGDHRVGFGIMKLSEHQISLGFTESDSVAQFGGQAGAELLAVRLS